MVQPSIAIIGASADRSKYGSKAVRAYLKQGYKVYPVNPTADTVEGLRAYKSVLDIDGPIDRVSIYLPPAIAVKVLDDVASKGVKDVWLNPGADSDEVIQRAYELGLKPVVACSVLAVGLSPDEM